MFLSLRCSPSITLTVKFLTKPPTTVRCAPSDTILEVKRKILLGAKLLKRASSQALRSSRHHVSKEVSSILDEDVTTSYVMVQNGNELIDESTLEACSLHNNASVEMMELDVWKEMVKLQLDQPKSNRSKVGAVGAAMNQQYQKGRGRESNPSSKRGRHSSGMVRHHKESESQSHGNKLSALDSSSLKGKVVGVEGEGRGIVPLPRPPDPKFIALLRADGNPRVLRSKKTLESIKMELNHPINDVGGELGALGEPVSSVSDAMGALKLKLRNGGEGWQQPFDC